MPAPPFRLEVPEHLQRNAPSVAALGYEETGQRLIELATRKCGWRDLADVDVLDVGCGVRFTMTLVNRRIPVRSYSGLEVNRAIVEFLTREVAARDSRFRFACWNARNAMYNPAGIDLAALGELPFAGFFDAIWAFSLITHLPPPDTAALLAKLRRRARSRARLFFSAFIDDELDGFEDRVPDRPLLHAYYGRRTMERLLEEAGWRLEEFAPPDPDYAIMSSFLCSPR